MRAGSRELLLVIFGCALLAFFTKPTTYAPVKNEKPMDTEKASSVSPNGLSIQGVYPGMRRQEVYTKWGKCERIGPTKGDGIEEILGQSNPRREVYLTSAGIVRMVQGPSLTYHGHEWGFAVAEEELTRALGDPTRAEDRLSLNPSGTWSYLDGTVHVFHQLTGERQLAYRYLLQFAERN